MYGKDQKHFRICMERKRRTLEDVLKRPKELQKLYGKIQKHSMEDKRKLTTEAVW